MLIGEAPGLTEDKYGIPFCGKSGKVLHDMLQSINIDKNRCYITNSIFWRPPYNRTPHIKEVKICRLFIERKIGLLSPKIIILIGATAVFSVLGIKKPMYILKCISRL